MNLINSFKDFMKIPFNRNLFVILAIIGLALIVWDFQGTAEQGSDSGLMVHFFFHPSCPHCAEQKPFNEELMKEFPQVPFVYHDVTVQKESELFSKMAQEHGIALSGVPTTFIGKNVIVGFDTRDTTGVQIRNILVSEISGVDTEPLAVNQTNVTEISVPVFGVIDAKSFSLPALAVVLGIVDGFNPCAMWVLVYLISIVLGLGDRKRLWLIVGTFLLASGILYFLFMTAWLNVFLLLDYIRAITIIVGLEALGGGILSLREYIKTKGALTCKVGDMKSKKKTADKIQKLVTSPLTISIMIGIIVLAFAVNSIEFVCSAGIPMAFTQVLALSNLSFWAYYGYIALYTFFFMLDDLIIFSLAAFAVSGTYGEKYSKYCKVIGGIIMLLLGVMLLFAPQLLH
ncbi:MAG: thioredoxin family protein [Candidatus Aenigmarchaeota archaeon]|nr:thioredoxin family protein [Candidatus Aenigmarchaeota archaeon]